MKAKLRLTQGMKKIYCVLSTAGALLILPSALTNAGTNYSYFLKTSGDRPYGIAFDGKGSMYMVTAPETGNGTLSLVTPAGILSKIATLEGTFIGPGITVDDGGNALVTVGDKLLKITHDGTIQTIASGFMRSFDVKLDKRGNIYVADDIKDVVYKITPDGKKEVFYSSDTTGGFELTAICIDGDQKNMCVRDGKKLLKLPLESDMNSTKPKLILEYPDMFYMCLDSAGNIYVSTLKDVVRIDSAGNARNLASQDLKTAIGLATGGKGFSNQVLYVTVDDGIIKLPTVTAFSTEPTRKK